MHENRGPDNDPLNIIDHYGNLWLAKHIVSARHPSPPLSVFVSLGRCGFALARVTSS
jgi:hypothetical protein